MKAAVVGCGAMGVAAVTDLLADPAVDSVLVVDRDPARLAALADALPDRPLRTYAGDAGDCPELRRCDVIGTASSWVDALPVTVLALEGGVPVVGIGRPPHDPRELVQSAGTPAVLGTGLEPGLAEVLARRAADRVVGATRLRLFCGGVPARPRPPLRHVSTFGPARFPAPRPTYMVRGGRITSCRRFSGLERVRVPGVGTLEAYHDAMLPWLTRDCGFRGVRQLDQKTLRWPGFVRTATVLADLGLLSEQPVPVGGAAVCPKDVVDAAVGRVLAPAPDDEDVTVLAVEAEDDDGQFRGGSHVLVRADRERGATGMALLTGTMLAATMTALVESPARGLMHPWELFCGDAAERLLCRLKRSGISVVDDVEPWLRRGRPETAGRLGAGTL